MDTSMISETFNLHKSLLKREMSKYPFGKKDFVKYKNIHLYREKSVLDFMENIVERRLVKDVINLKKRLEKEM
jgi:hypothetical protein